MAIRWRVEPLKLLKENGYTTYRIRKEKLFAESTVQKMRHKIPITMPELDTLCELTGKQPGKLIEWVKEKTDVE